MSSISIRKNWQSESPSPHDKQKSLRLSPQHPKHSTSCLHSPRAAATSSSGSGRALYHQFQHKRTGRARIPHSTTPSFSHSYPQTRFPHTHFGRSNCVKAVGYIDSRVFHRSLLRQWRFSEMASGVTSRLEVKMTILSIFPNGTTITKSSRGFANAKPASRDTNVLEDENDEEYMSDTTNDIQIYTPPQ